MCRALALRRRCKVAKACSGVGASIGAFAPDVLVKGGDWPVEKIVGSAGVLARGGDVRSLPFHPGHSTTSLIARIDGR